MSVDHTVFAIVGVVFKDEETIDYIRDCFYSNDDYFNSRDCIVDVFIDGYCDKYAVIGSIVGSFDKYGDGQFKTISADMITNPDVLPVIIQHFPKLGYLKQEDIQFQIFSHFS